MHARYHVRTANSLKCNQLLMIKRLYQLDACISSFWNKQASLFKISWQNAYENTVNISKLVYVYMYTFSRYRYTNTIICTVSIISDICIRNLMSVEFIMAYWPKHNCQSNLVWFSGIVVTSRSTSPTGFDMS